MLIPVLWRLLKLRFQLLLYNMKFLKHFFAQTGVKPLLIGLAIVVPVWTYFWSKQDGQFNPSVIIGGVCFVLFVMLCEWITFLIKRNK
jgi:hypothetical protein